MMLVMASLVTLSMAKMVSPTCHTLTLCQCYQCDGVGGRGESCPSVPAHYISQKPGNAHWGKQVGRGRLHTMLAWKYITLGILKKIPVIPPLEYP